MIEVTQKPEVLSSADCDIMLLLLNARTWSTNDVSQRLEAEVIQATKLDIPLVLAHEMPGVLSGEAEQARCACEFHTLVDATPTLRRLDVYSKIAVPLKGGEWRKASLIGLAMKLTDDLMQLHRRQHRRSTSVSSVAGAVSAGMKSAMELMRSSAKINTPDPQPMVTLHSGDTIDPKTRARGRTLGVGNRDPIEPKARPRGRTSIHMKSVRDRSLSYRPDESLGQIPSACSTAGCRRGSVVSEQV